MGRTIPSFRMTLAREKGEWKPFRNALDMSEKKLYDEMWDVPRLYILACSNSCQLVPLQPIIMSILFHHYKELKQCMTEVKQMGHQSRTFTVDRLTVASASDGSKEVTLFLRRF